MGSSESSKTPVRDIGVDETKKKMIIDCHQKCILKAKFKEIKNNYGIIIKDTDYQIKQKIVNKGLYDKDKWFINFVKKYVSENEEMADADTIIFIRNNEYLLDNSSEFLDLEYDCIPDNEKDNMLSKFKLLYCWWFYQRAGLHRVLQLKFRCEECGTTKTIEMDKTTGGKNISYENNDYDPPQWWHWKKTPYSWISYNFNDILRYYRNASNYYHWRKNNCKDFAHSVYDKIQGKQTYA